MAGFSTAILVHPRRQCRHHVAAFVNHVWHFFNSKQLRKRWKSGTPYLLEEGVLRILVLELDFLEEQARLHERVDEEAPRPQTPLQHCGCEPDEVRTVQIRSGIPGEMERG
jgi:hypothetical protein